MDWKIELVPIPVEDVDRAKAFYTEQLGFNLDHDLVDGAVRVVQVTPPGSACSIVFGTGVVDSEPGSVQNIHLVVSDIHAARAELVERGIGITEVQYFGPGVPMAFFIDPDGNSWALQQLPY